MAAIAGSHSTSDAVVRKDFDLHGNNSFSMAEGQTAFTYNDDQIRKLVRVISLERLQPYLRRTRDDKWLAVQIYNQNTELSKELYGVLQVLEILLRNCVHTAMSDAMGSETWYFALPLRDAELGDIEEVERAISPGVNSTWLRKRHGDFIPEGTDASFVVKPGRVIAALALGFWVKLCANAYEGSVWPSVARRFPRHLTRSAIHQRLMELKTLRNRVAHHETLINRNREQDYADLLEAISWLSPTAHDWAQAENRFLQILHRPLPKRPRPSLSAASGQT